MDYKGYTIETEKGHVIVTSPNGEVWREETVTEAKEAIDQILEEE